MAENPAATAPVTSVRAAGLIRWIERRPGAAFGSFLAMHFVVWTALPALLYANLPLDLIEALVYGREWQLGYDKLPPLPWWLIEAVRRTFDADIAYYAAAQLAVLVAFALVFALARQLVGATGALIAVLIIDGLHYFQYTAVKFNHDVIQLPFWALAGYAFHTALRRGGLGAWCLLGFAMAGALWAKYFVVVLAVPYALFMLFDRQARRAFATPGPWLALCVALVVAAPHIVWLFQSDFLPFAYASHRAAPVRGWFDHVLHPAVRSSHRHAARFRPGADDGRAYRRDRPGRGGDVGLSAVAVSRVVVGDGGARALRYGASCSHYRHLGDRVYDFRVGVRRELSAAAAARPPLSRRAVPGQ